MTSETLWRLLAYSLLLTGIILTRVYMEGVCSLIMPGRRAYAEQARMYLLDRLSFVPQLFHETDQMAKVMHVLSGELMMVGQGPEVLFAGIACTGSVVFTGLALFQLSWELSLLVLLVQPVGFYFAHRLAERVALAQHQYDEDEGKFMSRYDCCLAPPSGEANMRHFSDANVVCLGPLYSTVLVSTSHATGHTQFPQAESWTKPG